MQGEIGSRWKVENREYDCKSVYKVTLPRHTPTPQEFQKVEKIKMANKQKLKKDKRLRGFFKDIHYLTNSSS